MKKVFIIHGHDHRNLRELVEIIERDLGLETVVLHEEPSGGDTVIEKFERLARECCYAVVLLTPDDHVGPRSWWPMRRTPHGVWQPRPNVVFELGWFCGRLGRDHVLFLCKNGTRLPSDFNHVMQTIFEESVMEPGVLEEMKREMIHAGVIEQRDVRRTVSHGSESDILQ